MDIQIGDTVRFLNEMGGGKVTGFQKGGIVLVEDEDGFEIPMLQKDVVVIPTNNRKQTGAVEEKAAEPSAPAVQKAPAPQKIADVLKPSALRNAAANAHTVNESRSSFTPSVEDDESETLEERVAHLERLVKKLTLRVEQLEAAKALRDMSQSNYSVKQSKPHDTKSEIIEVDLHIDELLDSTAGMSPADMKAYQLKVFHQTMDEHKKDKGRRIVFIHGNGDGVLRKAILDELKRCYKSCLHQDASFQQYGFGATMVTIR